jgi:predicted O-methyltransferase YrrM
VCSVPLLTASELPHADDERARLVAAALATRKRGLGEAERSDIEAIERRRRELIADERQVELRFYGADDPASSGRGRMESLSRVAQRISAPRRKAMCLYGLVRGLAPTRALEMGTGVGISGAYQGTGLRHGGGGAMVALDGAPDLAAVAGETYAELGLDAIDVRVGPFAQTLPPVLDEGELGYALVDGHHQEQATLDYFELLVSRSPGVVLVFDDIRWSDGMLRAWERIARDPRAGLAADLGSYGVVFTR